ncbi:ribosomal subunit 39S-domain-containing protein [Xylaria venustula]|nr:ribosomal subunit 39S-domain-containing protein [Xylaria venustula]
MRRIPRLGRPYGLTSSTTNNISKPTTGFTNITSSYSQRPAPFSSSSSQPTTSTSTSTSPFTSRTTQPSLSPSTNRFYSSSTPSSDKEQTTPTTVAQEDQTALQPKIFSADQIISAEPDEADLNWQQDVDVSGSPYVLPPERVEAARANDVADPTYAPASSAAGLKTIGGLAAWWNRPENWAASGDFAGFRPWEKIVEPHLIEAAVRRAVIEALALREVGRGEDLVGVWPAAVSKDDLQGLLACEVKSTADGGVVFAGGNADTVVESLRWKEEAEAGVGDRVAFANALTAEEASALSRSWDPSWKGVSLADARLRFAVTKRVFQLTGQRVPDHQLESITTVQTLLHTLKKPAKPATLTEELQKRHPDLLELPNVTIASKRVTRGDKEIALGRFKLMQEEFKKRQLPVYGHGYARKGKEVSRLRGGT